MAEHLKDQAGPETEAEPERWPTTNDLIVQIHASRTSARYIMPSDNHDDDDPALEEFLEHCQRYMAHFPTLWGEVSQAPAPDWVKATTDALVAEARANREGETYPTAEQTIANLPVVRRALCDHLLDIHPTAMDVARRLASIIDAIENVQGRPTGSRSTRH